MPQQVEAYLRTLNIPDVVKADAWDAVYTATDDTDAEARLRRLPVPNEVRAHLWDLRGQATPAVSAPVESAPMPSATSRFLSNAGEMLNPVTIAQGLYGAVRHPVDTATNIGTAQWEQARQAWELAKNADTWEDYLEALGRTGAAALPVLGPVAAEAGEQIGAGDVAGGLGKAVGVLAPTALPTAARVARAGLRTVPISVAARAETHAATRVADVMAPKVGPNKTRFGNMAENVAPRVAQDLAGQPRMWTRDALRGHVQTRLMEAEQALDAASDIRLAARSFHTTPLIDALLAKRLRLTAERVEASRPIRAADSQATLSAVPLGESVVPGPNAARVAVIDQAISELQQLGPVTRYDPIRVMRQAYDGPAKAVYSPSMTADYMKAQGGKLGAADVTGVLRDTLAKWDPPTAVANAQYHLWRTADDVLQATVEVERTRPRVGRQIIGRLTGTVLGGQAAGAPGAVAGYVLGPVVDTAAASGATTQLATARAMARLAQAIRKGDVGHVSSLASQLRRIGATASAQGGRLANQAGSPAAIEPARP